eukprot:GHVL01024129.1.p1 GENE.GHVL01024129.1~~GHVL01024129.1.p1  ORF type:complete len:297 (+),score=87.46 GHVL01024129.1:82-972(+)
MARLQVQRDLQVLLNERMEVNERLYTLNRTNRLKVSRPAPTVTTEDDTAEKKPRKLASVVAAIPRIADDDESASPVRLHSDMRPKVLEDEQIVKRHKNMLQRGLLCHLSAAKKRLEDESHSQQQQKMREKQEAVKKKICNAQENFAELRRMDAQGNKQQAQDDLKRINRQIEEKDMYLLQCVLEDHYKCMGKFIRTKAEPAIFWLPVKHNEKTKKLLRETADVIERKMESLKHELKPPPAPDSPPPAAKEEDEGLEEGETPSTPQGKESEEEISKTKEKEEAVDMEKLLADADDET